MVQLSGNKLVQTLKLIWQFICHLTRRFFDDGCRESAAALTYITLIALVPLLTLMFSMFSAVSAFEGLGEQLRQLIFQNFLPSSGFEIEQYLREFSDKARNLNVVGGVILIVTSYMMLVNIESSFNKIWGTAGGRKGLSSFLLYWALLSLGPLLVGVGLYMNTYLLSYEWLVDEKESLGVLAVAFKYLPLVFTWMAASLLFIAVPNCEVTKRYALYGGLVTTLLFDGMKSVFGALVANSSYYTIYGAFAVLPLFLLWVYLGWTLVLAGAEFVRSLETFKTSIYGYKYPNITAVLIILWEAKRLQERGETISDKVILKAGIEQQHWQHLRDLLLDKHVLTSTNNKRFVVTRDLYHMQLRELAEMLGGGYKSAPSKEAEKTLEHYEWFSGLTEILIEINNISDRLLSKTVGELFDEHN